MSILIKNAKILTLKPNDPIKEGEILIEDGRISYVGPKSIKKGKEVIDAEGNLIMPGFKNAHTHSAMSFARSIADDLPLQEWLFKRIFPMEDHISKEDQYHLSKVSILEYLSSGITSCFDMYYNPFEMAKASKEMGFRSVLLGTVTSSRESVAEMKDAYLKINGHDPLITYQLGFHAEYTCSEELLVELSKASHELQTPIYTHISETPKEVEECKARHRGLTPPEYFESLGLWDYGGGGFHCVAFNDNDIEIFKRHNCHIITNPGSNSKLASGIAPLTKFDEAGLNIAIGTDGPGSNNGLDFFYEMRLACVLQKLLLNDPSAFDALKALTAATVGGAKAMLLNEACYLEKGALADLIMIDLKRPSMQPLNNIANNIVYSGAKDIIKMTMVNGKILYQNGVFYVGQNVDDIYSKAQEITERLKASV